MAEQPWRVIGTETNMYHVQDSPLLMGGAYKIPPAGDDNYIKEINRLIKTERVTLLYAAPDAEVWEISKHRNEINCDIYLPDHEVLELCGDKLALNLHLKEAGVPVPPATAIDRNNVNDRLLSMLGGRDIDLAGDYMFWLRATKGAGSKAAIMVKSVPTARSWMYYWEYTRGMKFDFMLSEFLPGKEYAFQSLWYMGELITSAARERLEYLFGDKTPTGQSSSPSVARSVHNGKVNETATEAILAVDPEPHGVFCVDLKEDKDGMPNVTEINAGRFFTTVNFFAQAGCNMPEMYIKLALGIPLEPQETYNSVPENLLWIRGVDKLPYMVKEEDLI